MKNLQNSVQLIGRLGDDVQVKETSTGKKFAKLSIAINDSYMQNGEKVEKTDWYNCTAWGKTAEMLGDFAGKGAKLAIQGKLNTSNYEAKDGTKRYVTDVIIHEFLVL